MRELNDAIDQLEPSRGSERKYSRQVEAMLRAVQEVVIVFNGERKVEFANRAAEHLFGRGGHCKGFGSRV